MSETPEHGREPIPGLPAFLPEGEKILWQGKPSWQELAVRTLHVRKVAVYFAALLIWRIVERGSLSGNLQFVLLSVAGLSLLSLLAWLMTRSTLYTITNKRVVMRFGIAMPISINLPFAQINTLELRQKSARSADIAIGVQQNPQQRLSYIVMWPHARPWRIGEVQPMLRCLRDSEAVVEILRSALLRDIDNEEVRHAVQPPAGTVAAGKRDRRPKYEPFPRAPLLGAGALIAFTIISVALIRIVGDAAPTAPIDAAVESVQLQFEDGDGGTIAVFDASTGTQIGELQPGSDNFLRATLRGLVRGRDAMKVSEHKAFGLYQLGDGRLLLVDSVSGREIDLWAFGETNARAFARFLPSNLTQVSKNLSRSDSLELAAADAME